MKYGSRWTAAAILLAATAASTLAQQGDLPSQEEARRHGIFLDSIDVRLTNVEVFVTRDGEPVTDLTAEDFEVFDDGAPMEITHFFRVDGGRRVEPTTAPDSSPEAEPEVVDADEAPSTVVVLVDQPFLSPISRKIVFDRLAERLDSLMSDGTQVMVVSKDRSVEIAQGLTSRRSEVQAALDRLSDAASFDYATEVRRVVQSVERGRGAVESRRTGRSTVDLPSTSRNDAQAALNDARLLSQEAFGEVRRSLGLLSGFVGSLAGLPGRKALLYVADRMPVRAGEVAWQVWFGVFGFDWGSELGVTSVESALAEFDSTDAIEALIADANANRVAFYPIGSGPDAGPDLFGAESRGLSKPGATRFLTTPTATGDGLVWLARGTGGNSALGRGEIDRFVDNLHRDLTHYYSLAYPSPHRGDGAAHSVEVRVRGRDDLEVRYLSEYRDKTTEQVMEERTLASLVLGASDNPLDVRVKLGKSKKDAEGLYVVPLEVRVPMANLVLIPDKKVHVGKVSIQLIVRDEKGRFSEPVLTLMPLEVPNEEILHALKASAVYMTELVMRAGRQTVAIGVHDDLGAASSTVNVEVDAGGRG